MSRPSTIESTAEILGETEKELDDLREYCEEVKRKLLAIAREEAMKVKEAVIAEASNMATEEVRAAEKRAEEEVQKRILEGEERAKALSLRIEKAFDKAVGETVKAILGE